MLAISVRFLRHPVYGPKTESGSDFFNARTEAAACSISLWTGWSIECRAIAKRPACHTRAKALESQWEALMKPNANPRESESVSAQHADIVRTQCAHSADRCRTVVRRLTAKAMPRHCHGSASAWCSPATRWHRVPPCSARASALSADPGNGPATGLQRERANAIERGQTQCWRASLSKLESDAGKFGGLSREKRGSLPSPFEAPSKGARRRRA